MSPFRIEPNLPVTAYKTYGMAFPKQTHTRPATCAEVDCQAYENGWKTVVPSDSPQAEYIRAKSERHFTETSPDAGLIEFVFPPGQRCFAADQHRVSLERPGIFTVRGGDWRGKTSDVRRHTRAEFWVEDFALNQQAIANAHQRGAL